MLNIAFQEHKGVVIRRYAFGKPFIIPQLSNCFAYAMHPLGLSNPRRRRYFEPANGKGMLTGMPFPFAIV